MPDRFPELLIERAATATAAARAELRTVELRFARVDMPGDVAVNRRGHPLTPSAAVLVLDPVATIANIGIHPTVTGPPNARSRPTTSVRSGAYFARATGIPAVFLQGCQGDVNPIEWWDSGDPARWSPVVEAYATRLANAVAPAMAGAEPIGDSLRVRTPRTLTVPIGDTLLAQLAGDRRTRHVELFEWTIGDVTLVAVPGEGFHAVEHELRAFHGDRLLVAGLSRRVARVLPAAVHRGLRGRAESRSRSR